MQNLNPELFTELTVEEAAIVEGGFFKAIVNKYKKLLSPFKPLLPSSPISRPIGGVRPGSVGIARPLAAQLQAPDDL